MVTDAFVIGGGPAGLAAAIALRTRGLTVTVADGRTLPLDKPCGEGLLPQGTDALRSLGVEAGRLEGVPLRGVRFFGEGVAVGSRFNGREGRGIRRTVLHRALAERAEACGVRVNWGTPVANFSEVRAGWVIGADGIRSRVRGWAGLDASGRDTARFGFQRHYQVQPWSDEVEVYWTSRGQVYVTPVSDSEVGLALLTRDSRYRLEAALEQLPELKSRVAGALMTSERGATTSTRTLRRVTAGHVALVGDASGSVDAITGEGLALSFRQAELLAAALVAGDLARYERGHRKLVRRPRFMGDLMLTLDRSAMLRSRALHALAARPALFAGLTAMHTGEARFPAFLNNCARLGVGMLLQPRPGA
jgi:flavin-dependent dehydrogenase